MVNSLAPVTYWRLSSFYFFYFALIGAWLPFWPLYLQDTLGFDAKEISYLAATMMATKIIAPNIWGLIADATGMRMRMIRWGTLCALLIFLAVFLGDEFGWLLVVVTGVSFFWNAVLAPFEVTTLSHLGGSFHRYTQIRLWGSMGFIAVVLCLGFYFDFFSIKALPFVIAVLFLGLWLSSLQVDDKKGNRPAEQNGRSFFTLLKTPSVIGFLLVCFLMQVSHGPYYTFFSVYLEDNGYSRSVTGLLWSLGVVAEVVIFIVMHRILARFSLRQIMLWSLLLSALRWLLMGYFVNRWPVLLFAQLLHAVSFGSFHAYAVEMVRRLFRDGFEVRGMALYSSASFGAGGAVGAFISGLVWGASPASAFVIASIACLLAMLSSCLIKH